MARLVHLRAGMSAVTVASHCAPAAGPRRSPDGGVVLVGNANVGKSALFGALTGTYVTVSNYPGTTVEVTEGSLSLGGRKVAVVDTPGTASFLPSSEDERVARDILLDGDARAVVVVADAKNLERSLVLALELSEMGRPFVFCLNMYDEAQSLGVRIDLGRLTARLGVEAVPTVAVRREGVARLLDAVGAARVGIAAVRYPEALERAVRRLEPELPPCAISARSLALMVLAGDETLVPWLRERLGPDALAQLDEVRNSLRATLPDHVAYVVNRARASAAQAIAAEVATGRGEAGRPSSLRRRLEPLTTHPVWGVPILLLVLWACYEFVGVFGAGTLVGLMEEELFGKLVNPWVASAVAVLPWPWARDLIAGEYGLVTMALTYAIALILPIVGTFFIAFGLLEDSGYLPRLAVMVNRVFTRMGLNGKAVLPMVLGLGCDTMATLTTRILESSKERLVVIILLALGVPCSAQLAVTLALLSPLPWSAAVLWASSVAGVLFLVGRLAAWILPGRTSDFVLELPPLRMPRPGNIVVKTLARVEWYLKEAVPLFVLGTLILFAADRLHLLAAVEAAGRPIVTGLLGLPPEAASAFVIGFLRRDFGAAGLFRLTEAGQVDPVQTVVALVTVTLFIPCIANFFMIVKERGWRTGLAVAGFILPFAIGVGAAFRLVIEAWPWR